jgi:hypothetical protein
MRTCRIRLSGERAGGALLAGARRLAGVVVPLAVLAVAGCGGSTGEVSTYPVQGQVLLTNGKPLIGGRVVFVHKDNAAPPAVGPIGADGRFKLTTRVADDGAVLGEYKVRIEPTAGAAQKHKNRGLPPFPLKYIDEDSSGLLITIRPEANTLDPIRLK